MVRAQTTEIVPGVHRLPLFGTGAFLICEDTITIVDAGWRWTGGRVLNQLHRLGRSPQEVSYIISTHMHLDHIGGMDHVKQHSSGRVAAHEHEVSFLQRDGQVKLPNPSRSPVLGRLLAPLYSLLRPPLVEVDILLRQGSQLSILGGMEVIHTPGHTPGSISLHFPSQGLLMVGDALEYKRGKLGLPSRWFTANLAQAKDSVFRMADLDFDILCFSHFPPIRKNGSELLRQFADSLS